MVRQPHPASLLAAVLLTVAALVLIAPGTGLVAPAAEVSASPALDAVDLMPGQPLSVSVQHGTIVALSVTDQTGTEVPGELATDGSNWSYDGNLGYGKTYTASGAAIGADGQVARISGTYRTVKPVAEVTPTIFPGTGDVVGVAAPVIVTLSSEPADRQAVEDRLQITTTPHVEGSWAWIQHDGRDGPSLDWRPREYWPSGTQVHVEADLYGMDLGGGHFGGASRSATSPSAETRWCWPTPPPIRSSSSRTAERWRPIDGVLRQRRRHRRPEPGDPVRRARGDRHAGNHHHEQPGLRLQRRHRTLGGADQQQR